MRVLLDTHALIWFLAGDGRLIVHARDAIEAAGAEAPVSAVSAHDIVIKHRLGKLPQAAAQGLLERVPLVSNEAIYDQARVA